jgi:hypothetical protein
MIGNSKTQTPISRETSITKCVEISARFFLKIEYWCFFGSWNLGFGV